MLIDDYQLEVFTPPCEPDAPRFAAKAHLGQDIRKVLPFLNAVLGRAEYNPAAPALRWRKGSHTIVFHPFEIAISNMDDRAQTEGEIRDLIELINRTWEGRAQIEPSEKVRQRPSHLEIYKLLPGTNCKECGESTCYNFALKLTTRQIHLDACPKLQEPAHVESRSRMVVMLEG
jgi:ArsR family metal-binding transcriptional regulator